VQLNSYEYTRLKIQNDVQQKFENYSIPIRSEIESIETIMRNIGGDFTTSINYNFGREDITFNISTPVVTNFWDNYLNCFTKKGSVLMTLLFWFCLLLYCAVIQYKKYQ